MWMGVIMIFLMIILVYCLLSYPFQIYLLRKICKRYGTREQEVQEIYPVIILSFIFAPIANFFLLWELYVQDINSMLKNMAYYLCLGKRPLDK